MLSFEEAQQLLVGLPISTKVTSLPLLQALGQVLADEVCAASDQPPFDRTTMDGYAVVLQEGLDRFEVVGTVLAGMRWDNTLKPGQAVRIMTGAPCPSGATVVPIERTDAGEDLVVIERDALVPKKNIAWQGQDAKKGERVIAAGTRLGPQTISAAAMAGKEELVCYQAPRIGVVTTGDEVGSDGPAGVRNSNGPYLSALCESVGVEYRAYHANDDTAALRQVFGEASRGSDIVVTVGGVSMGTADLVPGVAKDLGFREVLHKVAMQPGKPVYLAQHPDGTVFLGLPGNPVSVLVTAHLFLLPLIGRFLGDWRPNWAELPLARDFEHRGKRRLFLPARFSRGGVEPVSWNGSGDFYSAARGDGLLDLQPGGVWREGDVLRFLPFLGHVPGETGAMSNPG